MSEAIAARAAELHETWHVETRGVAQLESELARLEHTLALAQAEGETGLPARTNVLNLVVYLPDELALQAATNTVSSLVGHHPSRTIFVIPGASVSSEVEADLSVHCLSDAESLPQICVEEIELRTPMVRPDHLPELLTPLLIPDLPTFAWLPAISDDFTRVLPALAELANYVILDSTTDPHTATGLKTLAPFSRQIIDFAWLRLLPWCELTAQFFDPEPSRRYLDELTRLQVEYVAPSMTMAVLYTGWLADRLGWAPFSEDRAPLVRFFRGGADPGQYALAQLFATAETFAQSGELLGVILEAQRPSATPARFQLRRGTNGRSIQTIARLPNGRQIARTAPLPSMDTSALLADALDQTGALRVYRRALETAVKLIG